MPRHCTTSVNNGDTARRVSFTPPPAVGRERVPTVVSHCNIRNDLLENRLALDKFLVLGLGGMEFSAEFLWNVHTAVQEMMTFLQTSIFPRWKNLASWPGAAMGAGCDGRCVSACHAYASRSGNISVQPFIKLKYARCATITIPSAFITHREGVSRPYSAPEYRRCSQGSQNMCSQSTAYPRHAFG